MNSCNVFVISTWNLQRPFKTGLFTLWKNYVQKRWLKFWWRHCKPRIDWYFLNRPSTSTLRSNLAGHEASLLFPGNIIDWPLLHVIGCCKLTKLIMHSLPFWLVSTSRKKTELSLSLTLGFHCSRIKTSRNGIHSINKDIHSLDNTKTTQYYF